MKKTFIIIFCILASVLTALTTVCMIIKSSNKMVISHLSSIFEISSNTSKVPQISSTVSSDTESMPQASSTVSSENKSTSQTSSTISSEIQSTSKPLPVLTFKTPSSKKTSTTDSSIIFSGEYAPNNNITLNGKKIQTNQNGVFKISQKLKFGNNKFIFSTDTQTKTFTIYRRYVVISSYSPKTEQTYSAGVYFPVKVKAKEGSKITATFNGVTISLKAGTPKEGFAVYSGKFTMPSGHFCDLNLGKVTFKGTHNGFKETFYSANVICKKEDIVVNYDPNATPKGGTYTNVGSGIITEIVGYQAETFDIKTNSDSSKPFNNYLPKGTLDYSSADTYLHKRDGDTYELITLRCGKTVYKSMRDKPSKKITTISKRYVGVLPDHNEITFNSLKIKDSHTVLSFDVNWKAPFYFQLLPQKYNSNLDVSNITYRYVDITFCYATVFNGKITIPKDNPLFSSAKIIKNKNDYTLRLFLKKQGGFYGWDSYYDTTGKLCFEFLNPKKVTPTNANRYGADLTGVKILIDVGHGGSDVGALRGKNLANSEANRNLILAKKLQAELSSIGATVYMTRKNNVTSTTDDKMTMLKRLKPDYCIAIHHDSNKSSKLNGFGSYYYYPFSKKASEYILNNSFNTGIYKDKTFKFHKYFMSRVTVCPVVLTENGYMSNTYDYKKIINSDSNTKKSQALTRGIVEYFLSIR